MSVVGIDLGTTNTVVGCVRAGKVHVLADEKGGRLLPSVVSFHPNGEVLVGGSAKGRRVIDARNTVYSHKRLIGRSWGSPEIAQARHRFAFELREGPGQGPLVHARGQDFTLPEISAFVLKRTRQIAEQALGTPIERAVITVPAHFNELQRASTKVAGRVSGLEVLRILNEPTAAALAYGLGRSGNERVAVYDFGGGTFDCTLLDLNGNVFEVLATAGDSFLGGDDIDDSIASRMAEAFLKQHRQDARQSPEMYERLKAKAEELKVALSTAESHTVLLKDFGHGAGGSSLDFQFTMTRRDLDALVTPLVDRTFKVTQDALALARLSPMSFDKVILVGGSTRMPLVRRRVEAFFGAPPMDRVNPDEVVAIGAAIQAAALTEGVRRRSIPAPPGVPGRPSQNDTQESTQTSELDPSMLKPAFGSEPPAFGFASSMGSQPPMQPMGARAARADGPGFGAIDETPSLFSTPSASLPSFPSMEASAQGVPSPLGADPAPWRQGAPREQQGSMPDGPFGAVADLSLVSTSGLSSPATDPGGFGHVSDLSLISTNTATAAMEAITSARTQALASGQFGKVGESTEGRKGGTIQLEPHANPAAARAPKEDHDSLIDRADLPAVVARAKPARKPGQLGGGPQGGASPMMGKAPPIVAPQPFGPMEKVAHEGPPPSRPARAEPQRTPAKPPPAPAKPPPAPAKPIQAPPSAAPNTTPMQARAPLQNTVPIAPPPPPPVPPVPPAPPPAPPVAYPQSHYASSPPPMQSHLSAPPPPQSPQAFSFGSAPPGAFGSSAPPAFGSAPPGPMAGATPSQPPIFGAFPSSPPPQGSAPLDYPHGAFDPGIPPAPAAPQAIQYQAPVLVDVTPRGLVVETAGGYTDTIIPRNSKIPCERTRRFATGRDMQTTVRVRVAQGESTSFPQNTYLGEVELSGLRPAARGEVTVAVTFEVDADGTLRVRARDVHTGLEARATLQLIGVADESSVVMMINRFAQQPVVGGPTS